MIVTAFTRSVLAHRRFVMKARADGFEDVTEGGKMWELDRGWRQNHRVVDVRISPDGKHIWARIEGPAKPNNTAAYPWGSSGFSTVF